MFSILLAATLASAAAPQLDAQDAGAYMLVRHDGELSRNFISKLQRDGSQWNMYQRKGDGSWTIVTCDRKPAYYVVGFVDGGAIAVPHVRLDPVTLEPVESP